MTRKCVQVTGEPCRLSMRTGQPGPAAVSRPCPRCGEWRCADHCECGRRGLRAGRARSRLAGAAAAAPAATLAAPDAAAAAAPPPAAAAAPAAASAASSAAAAPPRARSRSAGQEGRRVSRATIEERLLRQWRGLAVEARPLPPAGRADSGLVAASGVWADGLRGAARGRTQDLLRSERWRAERSHSSVHLTLFLRWAEEQLRLEASTRVGALDLGRHIQEFLP